MLTILRRIGCLRLLAILVGLGLVLTLLMGIGQPRLKQVDDPTRHYQKPLKSLSLPSDGLMGHFDKSQLRRGFTVFQGICASCHSLNQVHFQDLSEIGYNKSQIEALMQEWINRIPDVDHNTGEALMRQPEMNDRITGPYYNPLGTSGITTAPDLSLMVKARKGGTKHIYSILTGYETEPKEIEQRYPQFKTPEGNFYNPYIKGLHIAMPMPLLIDNQVIYEDGTKATVDQMAKDVTAFLQWSSEPELEKRHHIGFGVIVFLLIATGLAVIICYQIWRDV
ncbi:MAG: cytochrome c1 [Zymomonas mobilis subsp. pomaceae]|uniref:Cytochrome c1 n=1 Tax=Zymomonas mobilis subsp. pomaceae (strain ATCC 29192 / DSM 22645 / JCM 10191 / CCUG 17912 / NBRC 13757 / NCIMB 11200 / NRRL B-4491 / Barker I) TaxID=579138 RepID=F8EUK2_ZYMMT|nr:cytochrome c1 [Zymomonas mobilis]AEI37218.1 cytochrome c1 [Zymomonas mobilis subsp. pomaceae ATCC 29192]MDX5948588.1 cytochrome c1 [Zymomonas mobilis subsp. pomaceae]